MAGLTGGKNGGGTTTSQSYYTPQFYGPYQNFETNTLNEVQNLTNNAVNNGMPKYTGELVAGFNPTQNQAFQQVQNLQGTYSPFFNNANAQLGNYAGYNPISAASPFFTQAGNTPTALQAGQPFATAASNTFNNPGTVQSYMSPYTDSAVRAAQSLQTNNFLQNVMPGLNSSFVASGGGLGGFNNAYNNAANWALTNFNQNLGNTTAGMYNQGYQTAGQQFQSDQARLAGLSGTVGGQAAQTQAGLTNLGSSVGNNVMGGVGTGINLGNAYAGLGTGQLNAGLLASNALLQTGNQQQQNQQQQDTANYNQWMQQLQWPYQVLGWGSGVVNQFQWPNGYSQQSSSTQPGSGAGGILGGLATLGSLAIPGAGGASALGNIFGGLGSWFGGLGSGITDAGATAAGASVTAAAPYMKRGGYVPGETSGFFNKGKFDPVSDHDSEPVFTEWPNHAYATGGYFDPVSDKTSSPVFSHAFDHLERRPFFDGGIDGPSDPVWTHWPDNAYAKGGDVPGYGIGGTIGGLLGSLFGGSGSQIGSTVGDVAGMLLPLVLAEGGTVPDAQSYTSGDALLPVPAPPAAAGSDAAIAREMEERQADEDSMKAAQWFNGALSAPNSYFYDNGTPFYRRPNREVQFDRGGFYGGDQASEPPFFEWADGYYNAGGFVPTVKVARGHYAKEVAGIEKQHREAEQREAAMAKPLAFKRGGDVQQDTRVAKKYANKAMHKHERVMHGVKKKSELTPALATGGFFAGR